MGSFLSKALERGLTPSNVAGYAGHVALNLWGRLVSTPLFRLKARLLGVKLGRGVRAHGAVGLMRWPGSSIVLGDGVSLVSSWRRATAAALSHHVRLRTFGPGARIELGEGCELSGTSIACRSTSVVFGRHVMVAPDVIVVDSDFHAPWPAERRHVDPGVERDRPVRVDDYAWIGMRSVILKGVHIGEGAIVGAGSVVTRDIPPYCVACGVPARVVRTVSEEERRGMGSDTASDRT